MRKIFKWGVIFCVAISMQMSTYALANESRAPENKDVDMKIVTTYTIKHDPVEEVPKLIENKEPAVSVGFFYLKVML
jgi:hypothetical protein